MKKKYLSWLFFSLTLLAALVIAVIYSVSVGEVKISISDIPSILSSGDGMDYFILTKIRIPRVILAIAVGGSLGLTGAILQGITVTLWLSPTLWEYLVEPRWVLL